MVIRSKHYDDVYFSAQDGLSETRYVFLDGCDLPAHFKDRAVFNIGETGFGTGLNFLAVCKLFEETQQEGQRLCFTSFEKFPLTPSEIAQALEGWRDDIGVQLDIMLQHYCEAPQHNTVYHLSDTVTLDLRIGDVADQLPLLDTPMDAWFLDGFAPAKNPDMWGENLLNHIGRLSALGGRLSTFTAAGFVKRGLQAAGFEMQKRPGFGRKREHLVGVRV